MATDPDDRFADLNERISRLEKAKPDVSTPEPPQSSHRTLSTADRRFRRANGWTIAIVLVLVLGLGVAQNWGKLSLLEMLWGSLPFFMAAAGVCAVNLFYWELGKGAARRIWKRQPPPK